MVLGLILLGLLVAQKASTQSNDTLPYPKTDWARVDPTQYILFKDEEKTYVAELQYRARELVGKRVGQCTPAVRAFLGLTRDQVSGDAIYFRTNSTEPSVGAIIKFRYGHMGVVIGLSDSEVTYYNPNGNCTDGLCDLRAYITTIDRTDKSIEGYWLEGGENLNE